MATQRARWLLSILLISFAKAGPPTPPSHLECFIPCDEQTCDVDIHCTWEPNLDPQIPAIYSLHWDTTNSEEGHVTSDTRTNGSIHREHFSSHGELHVWVVAKNQHGSAESQKVIFNNADIIKPPPPNVILSHQEPLEIEWNSICNQLELAVEQCEVRHRAEADQVWLQYESGIYRYTLDSLQPCTIHEVQVRCACGTSKKSDWSKNLKVITKTAPVGELDIWRDCGTTPRGLDCALIWKKLPKSQACDLILGYEVRLSYNNGTVMLVNLSLAEPSSQLVCDGMQCYFNSSLKDVSSVNVSAYNAYGVTVPSYMQIPVKEKNGKPIDLKMNHEIVSWNLSSQISDNLNEIIVQYKQAGYPLGQRFDWIKVNKSQTTGYFKGQFIKSTPYNVSLFTVSQSREIHHLSSVIGYSFEGIPPRVPLFKVLSIAATQVTLFWDSIPLSKQNGVIRYYQIGLREQNVHNVNSSLQHDNNTFELKHLSPDHEYEVWIRAVTAAGFGENTTLRFKTKQHENDVHLIQILPAVLTVFLVIMCFLLILFSVCRGENKASPLVKLCFYDKVPDPSNSHIFRQMKHQINDPLAWLCIPIYYEPHPKISVLEIVEMQPGALSPLKRTSNPDGFTGSIVRDGCLQMDCQGDQKEDVVTDESDRTDDRYRREEYSKMVDSDEERGRDDCWNSSEEEQFTSGC